MRYLPQNLNTVAIILATLASIAPLENDGVSAQLLGVKGGTSSSSFRQSIEAVRLGQQPRVASQHHVVEQSVSQVKQQPAWVTQQKQQVVEVSSQQVEQPQVASQHHVFEQSVSQVQQQPAWVTEQKKTEVVESSLTREQQVQLQLQQQQASSFQQVEIEQKVDAEPAIYGSVAGLPGVDFPAFTRVPKTTFRCTNLPFENGMYADEQTGCQAFHICFGGRQESFLCGIGTVFNQAIMNCDYWHSVDCSKSAQFYALNAQFGIGVPEPSSQFSSLRRQVEIKYGSPSVTSSSSSFVNNNRQVVVAVPAPVVSSSLHRSSSFEASGKTSLPKQTSNFFSQQSSVRSGGFVSPARRQEQVSWFKSQQSGQPLLHLDQSSSETSSVALKPNATSLAHINNSTVASSVSHLTELGQVSSSLQVLDADQGEQTLASQEAGSSSEWRPISSKSTNKADH